MQVFHRVHEERYGHQLDKPVEALNLRVKLAGRATAVEVAGVPKSGSLAPSFADVAGFDAPIRCHHRESLFAGATFDGPALLIEHHSTAYVHTGWRATVDATGNVMLARH